jgi:hypothetical protein
MAEPKVTETKELKLLEDYYLSAEGLMIFTEAYHLKRGFCCGSGCMHCPYDGISIEDVNQAGTEGLISIQCPFCFETFKLPASPKDGETQNFVYDCEVCCNPIDMTLHFDGDDFLNADVEKSN